MIRVLIAGEGSNELGPHPQAEFGEGERASGGGAIEALMAKVRQSGWQVVAAMVWKDVRKLKSNAGGDGEAKTIAGLVLRAKELGCHALVFLRDRDGSPARERAVRDAIANERGGSLRIAGGVPIEMLECWLLALRGEKDAHADADPVTSLAVRHGVPAKRVTSMVQLVRASRVLTVPADAESMWRWLRQVAMALSVTTPKQWPSQR
jgi:hypothetical protein